VNLLGRSPFHFLVVLSDFMFNHVPVSVGQVERLIQRVLLITVVRHLLRGNDRKPFFLLYWKVMQSSKGTLVTSLL
jgi:hypothetical protein